MNVYLIHQDDSDLYKIGVSKHVNKRLKENQTGNGNILELIKSVPCQNPYMVEAVIHRLWNYKRAVSEWFILSEEDVTNFDHICYKIDSNLSLIYNGDNDYKI